MISDAFSSRVRPSGNETIERPDQASRVEMRTNQARAGVTGHNVRYVLGFGLVAVVLAFAAILYLFLKMQ
jgi:hypothetical protein